MNIFILPIQSCIDVITNSSSEIFIVENLKSDVLTNILKNIAMDDEYGCSDSIEILTAQEALEKLYFHEEGQSVDKYFDYFMMRNTQDNSKILDLCKETESIIKATNIDTPTYIGNLEVYNNLLYQKWVKILELNLRYYIDIYDIERVYNYYTTSLKSFNLLNDKNALNNSIIFTIDASVISEELSKRLETEYNVLSFFIG